MLLPPEFERGDLAQWKTPLCVVRILDVELDDGGLCLNYLVEAVPGINGSPLDVPAGMRIGIGPSLLKPLDAKVRRTVTAWLAEPIRDPYDMMMREKRRRALHSTDQPPKE
jgi:hypothetical protein